MDICAIIRIGFASKETISDYYHIWTYVL